MWVLRIQTHVLMLEWPMFYLLNHLPALRRDIISSFHSWGEGHLTAGVSILGTLWATCKVQVRTGLVPIFSTRVETVSQRPIVDRELSFHSIHRVRVATHSTKDWMCYPIFLCSYPNYTKTSIWCELFLRPFFGAIVWKLITVGGIWQGCSEDEIWDESFGFF